MDAITQKLRETIKAADRAITAEGFDELMKFYADDASLVVKPGSIVQGRDNIRRAFVAIAQHFNNSIVVTQGDMQVVQGGDVAPVIMETVLQVADKLGESTEISRRATYVFRQVSGEWLCVVDNSCGTALLDGAE